MIFAVILAVLAVFFASYNQTMVEVTFFGIPVRATIGLFLVLALGLGVLIGVLLMLPGAISRSWRLSRHERKLSDLERKSGSGS
jgi:uncharacterized integral membrane protein